MVALRVAVGVRARAVELVVVALGVLQPLQVVAMERLLELRVCQVLCARPHLGC